ncbi:MAG: hypothetical protein HQL76_13300 [Magnetococcales bacterium]|nr:hypothetical protein [Magnetococcales bacterium]
MTSNRFVIDSSASRAFAVLSGDFNPIHLDPLSARRMKFGRTIVHGMHLCLQTLELGLADGVSSVRPVAMKVSFSRPVYHGQTVLLEEKPGKGRRRWTLSSEEGTACTVTLKLSGKDAALHPGTAMDGIVDTPWPGIDCTVQNPCEVVGLAGILEPCLDQDGLTRMFPVLARRLPHSIIVSLLAATRIVGMICPGYHSLFSGCSLDFSDNAQIRSELAYRVEHWDERTDMVTIALSGLGVQGTLETFFRSASVNQTTMDVVRRMVAADAFADWNALVAGGSRGLGEVTGKIIAAGGGRCCLTYGQGALDAQHVCKEITAAGGRCGTHHLDILKRDTWTSVLECGPFSHLFYFASPPILFNTWGNWREDLYRRYVDFYQDAFREIIDFLLDAEPRKPKPLGIFYPSTVFLDTPEPGADEYIKAKEGGERLCDQLKQRHGDLLDIHCPRLPRMLTDQTASDAAPTQDPLKVMLGQLSAMAGKISR